MSNGGPGRRLPVAGEGEQGPPDPAPPPPPPSRIWNVVIPAVGAVVILVAGFVAQCGG